MHILRHMFLLLQIWALAQFSCVCGMYIWSRSHPETASTVRPSWRRALRCFDPTTHPLISPLFIKVPIVKIKDLTINKLLIRREKIH